MPRHARSSETKPALYAQTDASVTCTGTRYSDPSRAAAFGLYYRAKGQKIWHYYLRTRVGADGHFHFYSARGYGYSFKVVFAGQFPFEPCQSRIL